jgi:hypothetical protein
MTSWPRAYGFGGMRVATLPEIEGDLAASGFRILDGRRAPVVPVVRVFVCE